VGGRQLMGLVLDDRSEADGTTIYAGVRAN
jgi:hypothetical protein